MSEIAQDDPVSPSGTVLDPYRHICAFVYSQDIVPGDLIHIC